jgi:integrase
MTTTTTNNNQRIRSPSLAKYIKNVQQANERTAEQYEYRLSKFEKYLVTVSEEQEQQQQHQNQEQKTVLDHVINELKIANNNKINPYDLLSGFVAYLQEVEGIENPNTIRYFVIAARNFLEYNDIEISPRKFKLKVRLPKPVIRHKEAISKEEIREILLKCSNIKLKTYLMLLAATGMRATEALALRHKDFDFDDEDNKNNHRQAFIKRAEAEGLIKRIPEELPAPDEFPRPPRYNIITDKGRQLLQSQLVIKRGEGE